MQTFLSIFVKMRFPLYPISEPLTFMYQRSSRLLLIDTDAELVPLLADFFRLEGFETFAAHSEMEARSYFYQQPFDILITDIATNSFNVKKLLAERKPLDAKKPTLFFSTLDEVETKASCFVQPNDTVVQKPCTPKELVATVRSLLSQTQVIPTVSAPLIIGPLVIYPSTHTLEADGIPMELTSTEFLLLEVLASKANQVVRKDDIYHKVLGRAMHANDRAIDVHVSAIRHKLSTILDKAVTIESIRGVGYQLVVRS